MSIFQQVNSAIVEYESKTGNKISHILLKREISENEIQMSLKKMDGDYLKQKGYYAEITGYPVYLDETLEADFILVPSPSK